MGTGIDGRNMTLEDYFASDASTDDSTDGETIGRSTDGQLDDALSDTGYDTKNPDERNAALEDLKPMQGGGPLLEEPSAKKLFNTIHREVERQKRRRKNRAESAKHWDYVRGGSQFSILEKSEDLSMFKQIFPPGMTSAPQPIPNKIDDLCNKIVAQMLVDQFLPNPKPDGDSDRNRGAADLTKKFLRANATADNCNDARLFADALQHGMTKASMYAFAWVDQFGGGWRPMQVKAHPQATDPNRPLFGPKLDPQTNQPITFQTANGPQTIEERSSDPVLRFVTPEDDQGARQFTEDAASADRQWMPKLKVKLLPPTQVLTLPKSAPVFTAHGILLVMYESLGEAKTRFKILDSLSKAELQAACAWRPSNWKSIVPDADQPRGLDSDGGTGGNDSITDDTLIFWYHRFCRIGPDYVDGAEVAVNGGNGGILLKRDTLREDVEIDDGTKVPVLRVPPVTQWLGLPDLVHGDPNGMAPVERFGGANETYAHLYTGILQANDQALNPNIYLASTSPVSREDINRRDGRPIEILSAEDKPFYEEARPLPAYTPEILDRVETGMNSIAGTNETANGLDSKYSDSGVAKQVSINQAKVGLSLQYQNFVQGTCYLWLIYTQLAQAFYTVPQMVKLAGQDSAYKQRWWVGSDLVGVSAIAVEPGSGTMMTAPDKANSLSVFQQHAWLTPVQAGERARASMSDDLGLPPDVHEEAINREIAEWIEGPPDGWEDDYSANLQAKQQYDAATQQQVAALVSQGLDQQTATQQVQAQLPAPSPKPLSNPFLARPTDASPEVAKIHELLLSRLTGTVDYTKFSPAWRTLVDQRWQQAFTNAGYMTAQQQQQMTAAGAAGAAQNGPPSWQQFVQDTTKKVMAVASMDIAKGIATLEGLGPKNTDVSAPIDQGPTAAEQGMLDQAARTSDQSHEAQQNALDRQHEATENAKDRATDVQKHAISGQQKVQQAMVGGALTAQHNAQTAALRPAPPPGGTGGPAGAVPASPHTL